MTYAEYMEATKKRNDELTEIVKRDIEKATKEEGEVYSSEDIKYYILQEFRLDIDLNNLLRSAKGLDKVSVQVDIDMAAERLIGFYS